MKIDDFIKKTPKAELHLHIEGTLEPNQMFKLAKKNNINVISFGLKKKADIFLQEIKKVKNLFRLRILTSKLTLVFLPKFLLPP